MLNRARSLRASLFICKSRRFCSTIPSDNCRPRVLTCTFRRHSLSLFLHFPNRTWMKSVTQKSVPYIKKETWHVAWDINVQMRENGILWYVRILQRICVIRAKWVYWIKFSYWKVFIELTASHLSLRTWDDIIHLLASLTRMKWNFFIRNFSSYFPRKKSSST